MASTIKQRLRRYNGTDYDTVHLETEKACITDFPSSMPASDVYSWAKASSKPSYSYSEVGAAASSHTHNGLPITIFDQDVSINTSSWTITPLTRLNDIPFDAMQNGSNIIVSGSIWHTSAPNGITGLYVWFIDTTDDSTKKLCIEPLKFCIPGNTATRSSGIWMSNYANYYPNQSGNYAYMFQYSRGDSSYYLLYGAATASQPIAVRTYTSGAAITITHIKLVMMIL